MLSDSDIGYNGAISDNKEVALLLPDKDQCDYITTRNPAFYRRDMVVDGANVAVFNYRMASLGDFENPTGAQTKSHVIKACQLPHP